MSTPGFEAFTVKATGRVSRIITDVTICPAYDPAAPPSPLPAQTKAKALWDTGATRSVISKDLATSLALPQVGVANVTHGGGASASPTRLINIALPHNVAFTGVLVTEFPPPADKSFDVIIGMDVICIGDLSITNVGGMTWMSFRTPSTVPVDYVVEWNRQRFAGVNRNAPCPCLSGKKFKMCHGAN